MIETAVIVFREVLEAALIISLVLVVTKGIRGRLVLASIGIFAGILGAVILALLAEQIEPMAKGMGEYLLNAYILCAAVIMLSWHLIWMRKHSVAITHQIKKVGASIVDGEKTPVIIAVIIGLAILREGSEIVILMYGVATAGSKAAGMLSGGIIGLLGGIAIGVVIYFGLARIPISALFRVSGWILLLLTAGLASHAASYFVQAKVLPSWGNNIWDTSFILTDNSVLGKILNILVGYVSQPMGIQVFVYIMTLLIVGSLAYYVSKPPKLKVSDKLVSNEAG